ncbi:hypothetical protein ASZ90_018069 [hydrocarbon metagenome]|uniref:Arc-like DNA binding domain-containing protein n=1 Tax=hydrocarbon metagenome TaxID=938273 RepID=A0A0W8E862_9ZZZZ
MAGKKSFLLRINPKLYDVMEKWAADELRSVNGHIEYLLRDAALHSGRMGSQARDSAPEITVEEVAADGNAEKD